MMKRLFSILIVSALVLLPACNGWCDKACSSSTCSKKHEHTSPDTTKATDSTPDFTEVTEEEVTTEAPAEKI